MLKQRILTATIGIPVLAVVIWFSEPEYFIPFFTVFAALWGALAIWELYKIVGITQFLPLAALGIAAAICFIIRAHFDRYPYYVIVVAVSLGLPMLLLLVWRRVKEVVATWSWTVSGILYVGLLLSYLVVLRYEAGRNWVFLAVLATFASDTAAYFVGKSLGRHPMAPRISPHKTWEGAAAGVVGAVIISLLFTLSTPLQLPLDYWPAVLLGVLISVFGQLGDLLESAFKRYAGIKESGTWLPGHGGLLDRMDSLAFAGVVVYIYWVYAG